MKKVRLMQNTYGKYKYIQTIAENYISCKYNTFLNILSQQRRLKLISISLIYFIGINVHND